MKELKFKLKIFKASEYKNQKIDYNDLKCSITKKGKLYFSRSTVSNLDIDESKSLLVIECTHPNNRKSLCISIMDSKNSDYFNIVKENDSFYVNKISAIFDSFNFDYKNKALKFKLLRKPLNQKDQDDLNIQNPEIFELELIC